MQVSGARAQHHMMSGANMSVLAVRCPRACLPPPWQERAGMRCDYVSWGTLARAPPPVRALHADPCLGRRGGETATVETHERRRRAGAFPSPFCAARIAACLLCHGIA